MKAEQLIDELVDPLAMKVPGSELDRMRMWFRRVMLTIRDIEAGYSRKDSAGVLFAFGSDEGELMYWVGGEALSRILTEEKDRKIYDNMPSPWQRSVGTIASILMHKYDDRPGDIKDRELDLLSYLSLKGADYEIGTPYAQAACAFLHLPYRTINKENHILCTLIKART